MAEGSGEAASLTTAAIAPAEVFSVRLYDDFSIQYMEEFTACRSALSCLPQGETSHPWPSAKLCCPRTSKPPVAKEQATCGPRACASMT